MQTTKQPYELLVRWDSEGRLAGAHVQWRYITKDGDTIVAEAVTGAESVAIGAQAGFPLSDILTPAQTQMLASIPAAA